MEASHIGRETTERRCSHMEAGRPRTSVGAGVSDRSRNSSPLGESCPIEQRSRKRPSRVARVYEEHQKYHKGGKTQKKKGIRTHWRSEVRGMDPAPPGCPGWRRGAAKRQENKHPYKILLDG